MTVEELIRELEKIDNKKMIVYLHIDETEPIIWAVINKVSTDLNSYGTKVCLIEKCMYI